MATRRLAAPLSLVALTAAIAACGDAASTAPAASSAARTSAAPSGSAAPSASAASSARAKATVDPELAQALDDAAKCELGANGLLQRCPADDALAKWVKAHKVDATLDACLDALEDARRRPAAASCLYQYAFGSSTVEIEKWSARAIDRALPILAIEKDVKVRAAITWAMSAYSADRAKRTDAIIAYLRTRIADPEATEELTHLLSTLFEAYLMQGSPKPADASVTLATELLKDARSRVREKSVWILKSAPSEATCHLLADVAEKEPNDEVLSEIGSALNASAESCKADLDRVGKAIAARVQKAASPKREKEDEMYSIGGMRSVAANPALPKETKDAIAKACDAWAANPKASAREKDAAQRLADSARGKDEKKK